MNRLPMARLLRAPEEDVDQDPQGRDPLPERRLLRTGDTVVWNNLRWTVLDPCPCNACVGRARLQYGDTTHGVPLERLKLCTAIWRDHTGRIVGYFAEAPNYQGRWELFRV